MLRNETATSPERRTAALQGLTAYQKAPRHERPVLRAAARQDRACLLEIGGDGPPLVLIPSLINPPFVLDLTPGNSLAQWLAERTGRRVLLLDWGTPCADDRDQDIGWHIQSLLLPLLRTLDTPPLLVGYCLGGTLALAAAMHLPISGLALIAAPWRFSGFGPLALNDIDALWHSAQPTCEALGLVPMEVLQSGFWRLDPARTIAKYERFATLDPDSDAARAFIVLEDWANSGAPLPYAAGRQMFDDFFAMDMPGTGRWAIGDKIVDPSAVDAPIVEFISTTDRIVPAASAIGLPDQRRTSAGHVGMVVGGRARTVLWEPLADWICAAVPTT
ncbi:alpha/beta fold hydrolase [Stakelama sediminis]|uniref:Polyhydroxyalkanoate synthase n=1 Tax=Stakelama sediminis TaxID=463200 RepID=A0A840YZS0_9SPHN|nr:alpha/beta fold hydrolase [Stakelama sediminis]MBB5719037.1 polyhydroxyalkanoate synthase [Stakelama sediminis]